VAFERHCGASGRCCSCQRVSAILTVAHTASAVLVRSCPLWHPSSPTALFPRFRSDCCPRTTAVPATDLRGAATAVVQCRSLLDSPFRMPDLTVLSATSSSSSSSSSNRDNAGEGYETPPRGQLRGLGAADGFEWLYELDNCGDVYAVPLSSKHVARRGKSSVHSTSPL
jgi:hypothetical protein